jgi:preprotein translocase subunit SecF
LVSSKQPNVRIRFDIVKNRRYFFMLSGILLVLGLLSVAIFGLNLGVDFKSGTRIDLYIGKPFEVKDVEAIIKQEIPNVSFKPVTKEGNYKLSASTTFDTVVEQPLLVKLQEALQKKYGPQVSKAESTVNPVIARELAQQAAIAVLIASVGIVLYIAIRFQFLFGIACVIALLHDVFIPISLFSVFRLEIDLTFIAAILTIVGYSINDTIVIFDRIRENLKTMKSKTVEDLEHLVNVSLWQTMARSINTVLTVFVVALAIALFGGEGIRNFSLALLFGLVSGTYSSIFIAAQIWVALKKRELVRKRHTATASE